MLWYSLEDTLTISQEVIFDLDFMPQRYFKVFYIISAMRLIVESPTPDLKNSLLYYKKIGFLGVEWKDVYLCQSK